MTLLCVLIRPTKGNLLALVPGWTQRWSSMGRLKRTIGSMKENKKHANWRLLTTHHRSYPCSSPSPYPPTPITTAMNTSTMQTPPFPPHAQQLPMTRNQRQSDLMLAVALAGLGTYAFYTTLGDMQTVIYTVGGAYVLRIFMQNPEIMRQVQARFASLQSGRPLQSIPPPLHFQGQNANSNGSALPRIDTSFNHPSGNGYQPLQATNGGSGLYDDFENSMATPTTPDPHYAPLPSNGPPSAASRMQSRPDSRASTVQQRGASPSITIATATPTVRAPPSIGMSVRPGTDVFDPRASTTSTFSAFAIPMTNPFASYQHYDNGTVNGERLLSPIHENDAADHFAASQFLFLYRLVQQLILNL